jgi:hypothetical protein
MASITRHKLNAPFDLIDQWRDVWEQKDIGDFGGACSAGVPSHGTVLLLCKPG